MFGLVGLFFFGFQSTLGRLGARSELLAAWSYFGMVDVSFEVVVVFCFFCMNVHVFDPREQADLLLLVDKLHQSSLHEPLSNLNLLVKNLDQ